VVVPAVRQAWQGGGRLGTTKKPGQEGTRGVKKRGGKQGKGEKIRAPALKRGRGGGEKLEPSGIQEDVP